MAGVSAEKVLEDISHGHLECPICQSRFTDPKNLKCLHSFCRICLEKMMKAQPGIKIICPVCRKTTDIPKLGIAGLDGSFTLVALVDEVNNLEKLVKRQQSRIPCESCVDNKESVVRCLACQEYLCNDCHLVHKRMKKTTTHKMATIDDLRSGKVPFRSRAWNDVQKCEKHNQDLLFYCETCGELICTACTAVDHKSHTFNDKSGVIKACDQKVSVLVKKVEEQLMKFKAATDKTVESLAVHKKMVSDKQDIITLKAREAIVNLTQLSHFKEMEFQEVLALNGESEKKIKDTLETVKNVMFKITEFDLIERCESILQNLQDAASEALPVTVNCLTFEDIKHSKIFSQADDVLKKVKAQPLQGQPHSIKKNRNLPPEDEAKITPVENPPQQEEEPPKEKIDKTKWRRVIGGTDTNTINPADVDKITRSGGKW